MSPAAASFRDPAGSCGLIGERVVRVLQAGSAEAIAAFLQTPVARRFSGSGQLVWSRRLEAAEIAPLRQAPEGEPLLTQPVAAVYEHERIPFRSYPYEWPPEMLWEAGRLTLELAQAALVDGYGLKDATPYNVLYRGSEAVFIDVPSFEPRAAGDPVWQPYGQFVRTFLLPLLANRLWGMRLADIFTSHRDGLEPEEVYRYCSPWRRCLPPVLSLVSMPTWLRGKARAKGAALYEPRRLPDEEKARFILESSLRQLQRSLESLRPSVSGSSVWGEYMATHSYSAEAFAAKEQFVKSALEQFKPKRVLDAGANTGHFSRLAAGMGADVVAIDLEPACVAATWQMARAARLKILPLVVDLARPTPAIGWRNTECPSFLARARNARFDGVLMLALLHHLLVTERIPLADVIEVAAELTSSLLIIEFVGTEDAMFRQLTRGRDHLHAGLNVAVFESACAQHFELVRSQVLPGTQRRLYAWKRKGGGVER